MPHRPDVMIEEMMPSAITWCSSSGRTRCRRWHLDLRTGSGAPRRAGDEPGLRRVGYERTSSSRAETLRFAVRVVHDAAHLVGLRPSTPARGPREGDRGPGGYDESAYETERLLVPARDGTPVPVSLVYRKGTAPDGTHPLWLYGYGSYGFRPPSRSAGTACRCSIGAWCSPSPTSAAAGTWARSGTTRGGWRTR